MLRGCYRKHWSSQCEEKNKPWPPLGLPVLAVGNDGCTMDSDHSAPMAGSMNAPSSIFPRRDPILTSNHRALRSRWIPAAAAAAAAAAPPPMHLDLVAHKVEVRMSWQVGNIDDH